MSETPSPSHVILQTRIVHQGWAKLLVATIRGPEDHILTREIEDHGSAICVLPFNRARKIAVLVRQCRAPMLFAANEEESLEAIAGILDEDDAAEGAKREAMEEAGLMLYGLQSLFVAWTMPGISTERMHFFLANYDGPPEERVHGVLDEMEVAKPQEFALSDLAARVDRGEISDLKTLTLLQTLRLREPELFSR